MQRIGLNAAAELARFFCMGFLIPLAIGRSDRYRGTLPPELPRIFLGLGLTVALCVTRSAGAAALSTMAIPVVGCLVGLRLGVGVSNGMKPVLRLILKSLLCGVFLLLSVLALLYAASNAVPPMIHTRDVTPYEKRRLVELFRDRCGGDDEHSLCVWDLAEWDVQMLTTWALKSVAFDDPVQIRLRQEAIQIETAVKLDIPVVGTRFYHLLAEGRLDVSHGDLTLQFAELQVGNLAVPEFLQHWVSDAIVSAAHGDNRINNLLTSVESLHIESGTVQLVGEAGQLRRSFLPGSQVNGGSDRYDLRATRAHVKHLLDHAPHALAGDDRLLTLLQTAFSYAKARSRQRSARAENSSAILALAFLLGHRRLGFVLGDSEELPPPAEVRKKLGRVTLRGRSDWTRHFFVSAGLTVLSDQSLSDFVGVQKEEIDSAGSSGFSFSDLLADRAGTLFASHATQDEASARALQERFAVGIRIDDIFPRAGDLPERISDDVLRLRYGGVGGYGYLELEQEINRRLSSCELLAQQQPVGSRYRAEPQSSLRTEQ